MCGICGFTEPTVGDASGDRFDRAAVVDAMSSVMYHRGPDGYGYLLDDTVALGHRRLSLVDLGRGAQPMTRGSHPCDTAHTDADGMSVDLKHGGTAIVFNGEIYNYIELRAQLEDIGYEFSTRSDTEVLLACWQRWGRDCLRRLRGMFAFAVHEPAKQRLTLARDAFGIKPLYWTVDSDGGLVFASEAKSLFEHPRVSKELDRGQLDHYLSFQYSVGERTFFKNVRKLAPGGMLTFSLAADDTSSNESRTVAPTIGNDEEMPDVPANITLGRWWEPDYSVDSDLTIDTASRRIAEAFDDSVKHHRIADVEVGMLLSGGVDSSYVASTLSEKQERVRAFTVGFEETDEAHTYAEIDEAVETSNAIGTGHDVRKISADEYWSVVPKVQWHMDEPNADPAAVALYFADELASRKVKAVMSGEGADELFGGYQIYNTAVSAHRLDCVPKGLVKLAYKTMRTTGMRGSNYLKRVVEGPRGTFIGNAYLFDKEERDALLKHPTVGSATPSKVVEPLYDEADDAGVADDALLMQYVDMNTWLVGDILQKTDRMSMANSVEARVPFLDAEVWKVARTLPMSCRIDGTHTKIAMRQAAATKVLPDAAARPKLGFPVPMRVWLKQDKWLSRVLNEFGSEVASEFFNRDELERLVSEHVDGQADNSRKIWAVYSFLVWYRVYFCGDDKKFRDNATKLAHESR